MSSPVAAIAAAVRRERVRKGLSLSELARAANLSKATLSQLEAGAGNPGVETVWALSVALGVPLSDLIAPRLPLVHVLRAGEGTSLRALESDWAATLLATTAEHARCDLYWIVAQPGRERRSEPHLPGTVEHVVVTAGRAALGFPDEPAELGIGDYIRYRGDVTHVFRALTPDTAALFVLEQA
jgi:transcriptional regulator with XRE-family HTH domain